MKQPWHSVLSGVAALVSAAALVVAGLSATVLDDRTSSKASSTVKPAPPAARSAISCPDADTVPLPRNAFPADRGGSASYVENMTGVPRGVLCLVNAERAARGIPALIRYTGSGGRLAASAGLPASTRSRLQAAPGGEVARTRTPIRIRVRRRHRALQPRATVAAQTPSSSSARTPTRAGARRAHAARRRQLVDGQRPTGKPSSIPNSRTPASEWLWERGPGGRVHHPGRYLRPDLRNMQRLT